MGFFSSWCRLVQYIKPYTYFVSKPSGTTNLLWGSLALFSTLVIPLVGQIVLLGYQSDVADDLEHDPDITDHRNFDPNKLGEYLSRGLWPMLMQFLMGMGILALVVIAGLAGVLAWRLSEEPLIGVAVGGALYVPFMMFGVLISWPMMLHTQLSRGFHLGRAVRFTSSFLRRLGGQLAVALMVHMIVSIPMTLVGMMMCFVGVFPAAMIQFMAQEHYMMQLYRVFLDEGGDPIGGPVDEQECDEM